MVEALPDNAVVCHSVQVRHGTAEHEIDLLVLWPSIGVACIEVKGGQISIDQAQWYQSDRNGKHRIKSPVAQSQSSMHAFIDMAGDHLGTPLTSRTIYLVALPYTRVPRDWEMAGVPRSLVLDIDDLANPLVLAKRVGEAVRAEGRGVSALTREYSDRLERLASGTLVTHDGGSLASAGDEDVQDALTERQQVLLGATRSIRHVRFIGGAGSGKTWLAVEKAKRLAREGKRVGLFCYNKGLGMHLRKRTTARRHNRPVFAGEFHEYVISLGVPEGVGQAYFDEEMPRRLIEVGSALPDAQKLDAIVVDEAQDFAPLWWDGLLSCVKDPREASVYAFLDARQDVYRRWDGRGTVGQEGRDISFVPIHVDDNLRNSRRIAETFKCFAGDNFTPRTGTGLPVRFVECATEHALNVASDCVDALIDEGWANNQIALLTTKTRHPIHQEAFDSGPEAVAEYWREFYADSAEFYGHVLGFKGLERSVVVLCVNGFKDMSRAAEQLYVGLSRARSLLVVVGDRELIAAGGGGDLAQALSAAEAWTES
ncbi:NERD domain-containing protein [Sinomonas sp. ASV486]|uniref:nuclease-related domain-containing DEAD/DEAH box helicase n=1 Tax=Sinomonas sp. ASV486 TaxID=3051170 RepID=UPI0027DC0845|nr:NERD domain-containing protein [Sinomonas sp. ASV486]MDQ4489047.1 NERD domain-containing protein [Sinomonas sp. ASV486]